MYKKTGLGLFIFSLCLPSTLLAETLVDIYGLAKKSDPQYKAAQASLLSAQESANQADAAFLPRVDLNFSSNYNAETTSDGPLAILDTSTIDPNDYIIVDEATNEANSNTNYSLSLTQPIFVYNNHVNSRINGYFVAQSETNFKAEEQNLIIRVADRYFNVLSAFDNLEFAKAEKEAIARQLDQTKQRFDVGLVAITDVHEAQARFDSASAETIAAESALNSTLESLRELTGSYPKELSGLKENAPLIRPEPSDIDKWTDFALKQNLNIIASQYSVDRARENIKSQRSGYLPTMNLTGRYSDTNGNHRSGAASVGLSVSMNLFNGGGTNSLVRQAEHDLDQSLENLEQTRRSAQRNVRDAYLDVTSGISQIKALKQAVVSSESAMKASEAGFEVGTRTTVDVLLTRQNLFNARRNLSQAKYQYITNTLRLKRAAGQLSKTDLDSINKWLE